MTPRQLGPYRIVRPLGRGGMGTVYHGVHVTTGESVAVKLLSLALGHEAGLRERFQAEIETLRRLRHPNIVRLLGFGRHEDYPFYAMELVDGNSLETEISRGRRFDWREVAQVGIQTCRALNHAHQRGVVHRDIKPGNLLLAADGQVKLSDFGIARLFGGLRITLPGGVLGTAEYMAPEQAEGKAADARSDLYSLGGVLYALLAGRPPLRAASLAEMLDKQRYEAPEPLGPEIDAPDELRRIIFELLDKDPARRVANADLLGRRLSAMCHAIAQHAEAPTAELADPPPPEPEGDAPRRRATVLRSATQLGSGAASLDLRTERGELPAVPCGDVVDVDAAVETKATRAFEGFAVAPPRRVEPADDSLPGDAASADQPAADLSQAAMGVGVRPAGQREASGELATCDSPSLRAAPKREEGPRNEPRRESPSDADACDEEADAHCDEFVALAPDELDAPEPCPASHPLVAWTTWLLAAALVAVGLGAWYLLLPPSADALFDRVMGRAEAGEAELLGAEADVEQFLVRFPEDRRAEQLRSLANQIALLRMQRKLQRAAKGLPDGEPLLPIERAYLEALNYARVDPDRGAAKLAAMIDLYDGSATAGPTAQCIELARRRLAAIRQEIGAMRAESLELIENRLDEADRLRAEDPRRSRAIYEAVVELYAGKPWAEQVVGRARAALEAF